MGVEGELFQRPRHLEAHIAGAAAAHAVAHIVAGVLRHLQRQITVHACAIGAAEHAFQLQIARQAPGRIGPHLPAQLQLALRIGIGKLGLRHLDRPAPVGILAPAQAGLQPVYRDAGIFKNTGKFQRPLAHLHIGRAPLLVEGEAQVGVVQTRRVAVSLQVAQAHPLQLALGPVAQRVAGHGRLPAQLQFFRPALQLPAR